MGSSIYPRKCECGVEVVNIYLHRRTKKHVRIMEQLDRIRQQYFEKVFGE